MTRRSSTVRAAAALSGFATAAALTLAAPSHAAPDGAAAAGNPVVTRHSVTLISGDRVLLQRLAGGNDVATVQPNTARLGVSYATREVDDQVYVIPTDAMPLLAAGKLDEELFNVSALVANGYDDAASDSIGLIVAYQPGVATAGRAAAPAGTRPELTLESINARSVREDKAKAHDFWAGLTGTPDTGTETNAKTMASQIGKIWLNRRVQVSLAESVPQVGAPQAWAAGFDGAGTRIAVLDTGVDATHPDLDAGKVVAAANFSTDADPLDRHGHGTHVASI
ncbi:MAG TPA: S8 family serine peptidase, partial [Pseudonocardiaceae bacterium]|nr:S8 family serine peptidase [Pseudonocardiaceae bacterium]